MTVDQPASPEALTADRIKHLELISAIISRMGANAFLLKAWSVVIAAAIFTISAKNDDRYAPLIVIFTSAALWVIDAYYLALERQFRSMFQAVAKSTGPADFQMDRLPFNTGRATWCCSLWSPSMLVYLIVATTAALLFATTMASG
jgi:hypothetical protein